MENKASKTKASASVPVVSGGNKIVEKKLNNQVVELAPQPTTPVLAKKGGAKKVEAVASAPTATPVPTKTLTAKGGAVEAKTTTAKTTTAKTTKTVKSNVVDATPALAATATTTTTKGAKGAKGGAVETKTTVPIITAELEAEPEAQSKLRYFKLFYNSEICGRYCGKKPKQAANKAFSSIVKDMKKDGVSVTADSQLEVSFTIKECTRNSKHKEYKYVGKRHLLKEPVKVSIENSDGSVKEIVYKFHNQLQKAPKE
jgi:hypothetical protein